MFADVLLPLAVSGSYTYRIPPALEARVAVGSRVVVPLGQRKFYTGIVVRLRTLPAAEGTTIKDIADAPDAAPSALPAQLALWQWIAQYYICTDGEVLKAALPAGLRPGSETLVVQDEDFAAWDTLSPRKRNVLAAVPAEKACSVSEVQTRTKGADVFPVVRRLLEKGAVRIDEKMETRFKPRTETFVRLSTAYRDEKAVNALLDSLQKRSHKQEETLLRLLDRSGLSAALTLSNPALIKEVSRKELLAYEAASPAALKALIDKGIVETYDVETGRLKARKAVPEAWQKSLSPQQEVALQNIRNTFKEKNVCLLHGVTSSGKTEIYTRLIRDVIAESKQVLYLLPEIALTTQLVDRLGRVFGEQLGVYHSKFPDAERVEVWRRQLSAPYPVLLGVRSALFLPYQNLGLIIVDEEHETSYKQQDPAPRYHARDAALWMAAQCGAKVLLGTATPSFESYNNARRGKFGLVRLTERYGGVKMPHIVVEDVKELRRKKLMKTPFSPRLIEEVRTALAEGQQAIFFQNRRGYSPILECHQCGWTPRCTRCDVSLTFHQRQNKLVCHYCGAAYDVPPQCPQCGHTELRDIGYGTEKIEAAAAAVFPTARIARLDLDTTRSRSAYERILSDFAAHRTDLLIGTQMVTKGLDFERVSIVGILNADQLLQQPDFRAYEHAYQMMSQVAGRAGRRGRQGLVVLQTRQTDLPVVQYVVDGNYEALFRWQMEEREAFRFPPFVRLVRITLKHRDEHLCARAAQTLATWLMPHFGTGGGLLGPDRPFVGRVALQYIRTLLVKIPPTLSPYAARRTLTAAAHALKDQPDFRRTTIVFDADPMF